MLLLKIFFCIIKQLQMKKIMFFLLMGFFCESLIAQECGNGPTGMNLIAKSTSTIEGMFYRPLIDKKYWSDANIPEYWKFYVISVKPYFSQGNMEAFYKNVDTTTRFIDHQVVGPEHEAEFDFKSLFPGVSYEVCIYAYCEGKKYGALCQSKTTTLEPPYILKFDSISDHLGIFKFEYKPGVSVIPKDIIFEYREKNEDWKIKNVNFGSIFMEDLKPGHIYLARYKVTYDHGVETDYSDEMVILF
jgi:hypothetical protein